MAKEPEAPDVPLLNDHTLVWMTHPDCDTAAEWPRSFLTVPDSGWSELEDPDKSPKVRLARSAPSAAEPATPEEK